MARHTQRFVPDLGLQPAVDTWGKALHERRTSKGLPSSARGLNPQSAAPDVNRINALSIVAHDLRGPLANLSLLLELNQGYAAAEAWDRVSATTDKALKTIGILTEMLNGFLDRARATGDPLSFVPAPVDMGQVVAAAANLNRPIAEAREVEIAVGGKGAQLVQGDKRLLIEAAENLISNAVKYAREGGQVTCFVEGTASGVTLTVSDDGPGLSDEDMTLAFRPFRRLSSHRENRGPSSGLGLWIVRLIAERHGGRVAARSAGPGRGVTFELRLPKPQNVTH